MEWQEGPLVALHPPGGGRRTATYSPLLFTPNASAQAPETLSPLATATTTPADWRTTMELEMEALRTRLSALESALGLTSTP
jgi:uncharacterized protein YceH (UPF0502 family)